jgi:hypothetical protein
LRKSKSEEAKLADKLTKQLSAFDLDLERVGIEIARIRPFALYNRFIIVAEAAVDEMEKHNGRNNL